jgi:hypothetical protein
LEICLHILTYGCNATCNDDAVGPEECGGPGGLRNVHVLRDGVGRVLLLYVAKDGDIAAADLAAVAQQRPSAGINPSWTTIARSFLILSTYRRYLI